VTIPLPFGISEDLCISATLDCGIRWLRRRAYGPARCGRARRIWLPREVDSAQCGRGTRRACWRWSPERKKRFSSPGHAPGLSSNMESRCSEPS